MPTTNNYIQVPPNSTGLKMQTYENTVGGNVVESEAVTLVRSTDNTEIGTSAQPVRIDPTGTTFQPVNVSKSTTILTTTPLGSNGTYTSAWFDSSLTGDQLVSVTVWNGSGGNLASGGFQIQTTDDTSNAQTQQTPYSSTVSNNANLTATVVVLQRYWRVAITNGSSAQSSFEVTATVNLAEPLYARTIDNNASNFAIVAQTNWANSTISDGSPNAPNVTNAFKQGSTFGYIAQITYSMIFNGATWDRQRTPTIFKNANATASGNTALWTPTAGKKFRIMRYQVVVPGTAVYATTAGGLTITFQDAAVAITGVTHKCQVGTAATPGTWYNSGWIDLGNGFLSAAANNVLNINLTLGGTGSLTDGAFVNVCGIEE